LVVRGPAKSRIDRERPMLLMPLIAEWRVEGDYQNTDSGK